MSPETCLIWRRSVSQNRDFGPKTCQTGVAAAPGGHLEARTAEGGWLKERGEGDRGVAAEIPQSLFNFWSAGLGFETRISLGLVMISEAPSEAPELSLVQRKQRERAAVCHLNPQVRGRLWEGGPLARSPSSRFEPPDSKGLLALRTPPHTACRTARDRDPPPTPRIPTPLGTQPPRVGTKGGRYLGGWVPREVGTQGGGYLGVGTYPCTARTARAAF